MSETSLRVRLEELSELERCAVSAAVKVRNFAYAPYSGYKVGAAVVGMSGRIYTGVNVENVHFKVPHAEENALSEMVKHGERRFQILVCAATDAGVPCMSCLQFMREFSGEDLLKIIVIGVGVENKTIIRCTFDAALRESSFGPRTLGINPQEH